MVNSTGFATVAPFDYVLLGEFGSETSEVVQVSTVTAGTHTLALSAATKFAHAQDTKATIIKYNQVRFYHTTTATFSATDPVTDYIDLQPDDVYTKTYDTTNTTGFGWFVFYNFTTEKATTNSNAIPYADFNAYSVKKILDSFFSLLNNKEMKLISHDDAFRYLNEAYAIAKNELNLVNSEYGVPAEVTVTTTSGIQEYALPTDFGDIVSVTNSYGDDIPYIPLSKVPYNNENETYTVNTASYFLRNYYIGFSPVPTSADTYYMYYKATSATLTSYYDDIDLPDNNFYPLVDWMCYRAGKKMGKPDADNYKAAFEEGIKKMKLTSFKQNQNNDSWEISDESNV